MAARRTLVRPVTLALIGEFTDGDRALHVLYGPTLDVANERVVRALDLTRLLASKHGVTVRLQGSLDGKTVVLSTEPAPVAA